MARRDYSRAYPEGFPPGKYNQSPDDARSNDPNTPLEEPTTMPFVKRLFCKDCKHYYHREFSPSAQYTGAALIEHQCNVVISMVTGEPDIRDAEAMRRGTYVDASCGSEALYFEKKKETGT